MERTPNARPMAMKSPTLICPCCTSTRATGPRPGCISASTTVPRAAMLRVDDLPAGYEYRVNSFSGHIENCFGATVMHNPYGPGSRMRGRFGDGSGRARIGSLSGDISLCNH